MNVNQCGRIVAITGLGLVGGCTDGPSPLGVSQIQPVTAVDVAGLRAAPDFAQSGRITIDVVPRGESGVIPGSLTEASTRVEASGGGTSYLARTTLSQVRKTAGEKILVTAILLDSSGSMSSSDPSRLRVGAAQQWLDGVTQDRNAVQAGVFDFGAGVSTECFAATRILHDYTLDMQAARGAISGTVASGGTPLYRSTAEVLEDMGLRFKGNTYERLLVVLTDGQDSGGGSVEDVIRNANAYQIRVVSLAFGRSTPDQPLAQVAQQTNGTTLTVGEATDLSPTFGAMAATMSGSYVEAEVQLYPIPPSGETLTLAIEFHTVDGQVLEKEVRFTAP
jgi:hypothetical protein